MLSPPGVLFEAPRAFADCAGHGRRQRLAQSGVRFCDGFQMDKHVVRAVAGIDTEERPQPSRSLCRTYLQRGDATQVLQEYLRLGHAHPAAPTRAQLLEEGVEIRATKRQRDQRQSRPASGFTVWMRGQHAARRAHLESVDDAEEASRGAFLDWQRDRRP